MRLSSRTVRRRSRFHTKEIVNRGFGCVRSRQGEEREPAPLSPSSISRHHRWLFRTEVLVGLRFLGTYSWRSFSRQINHRKDRKSRIFSGKALNRWSNWPLLVYNRFFYQSMRIEDSLVFPDSSFVRHCDSWRSLMTVFSRFSDSS